MKGQMFIILAIIVIVTVVLLKISLNVAKVLETKKYLESGLERLEFQNIRDEIVKVTQISYNQSNMSSSINNFIKFSRASVNSRAMDLNGFFVETVHPIIVADNSFALNITIYNFLKEEIKYLNISLNGTERTYSNVAEDSIKNTNYNLNIDSSKNYTLWIFYNTSTTNSSDSFVIPMEIGKSKFVGFFDLRLVSSKSENRDKFIETVTLP